MFFHIGNTERDNFPYNHRSKDLVVSLDEGWSHTRDSDFNDIWYKGYMDNGLLSDHAIDISREEEPTRSGNFCVIKVFDQGAIVRTDKLRSFPIYLNNGLTNLEGNQEYPADSLVKMFNDLTAIETKFDAIGEINQDPISFDDAVDQIDQILRDKIRSFVTHQNLPIRVFLSGGIDTATLYSYVKTETENYQLVPYSHCDFDYFYLKNHAVLETLWGYRQIHHWKEPSILASGAPGDEFTVRGPSTINLLLLHHGTSMLELVADTKYNTSLHHTYFSKPKNLEFWRQQTVTGSYHDVVKRCCEINLNDYQHWHLGNTLTWTPFRDLEIFKIIARLGIDDLKTQIMDSSIQQALIKRNDPKILNILSDQKNSANYLANLTKII